jgi:hypothetical protein
MKLKINIAVVIILLVIGIMAVDAKGKSGGGKSGSSSKSFSQKSSSTDGLSGKAAGVASLPFLAKSSKKKHIDDDIFENETEEELEEQQQSPGPGVLPAFTAMGLLFVAWRVKARRWI